MHHVTAVCILGLLCNKFIAAPMTKHAFSMNQGDGCTGVTFCQYTLSSFSVWKQGDCQIQRYNKKDYMNFKPGVEVLPPYHQLSWLEKMSSLLMTFNYRPFDKF